MKILILTSTAIKGTNESDGYESILLAGWHWGTCEWKKETQVWRFGGTACPFSCTQVSEYSHTIEGQDNQVLEMNHALKPVNPIALASS